MSEGGKLMNRKIVSSIYLFALLLSACTPKLNATPTFQIGKPHVLASTSILADIAQNVAGDRLKVDSLLPLGVDPHAYQPRPADAAKVAESTVLILNGENYEQVIQPVLDNAGGQRLVIEASAGLTPRKATGASEHGVADPHFWLDPNLVINYVENIRDGLSTADPEGSAIYRANADAYIQQLKELDTWIQSQVDTLTPEKKDLVTNHESLGYFADRYKFNIIGEIIPSLSSEASPSAQEMTALVDKIRSSNAMAIFLDAMDNPKLAEQVAQEAGVKVINDLHLESLTPPDGVAPTYLEMMKYNTSQIVKTCKG
jgi:ABC-type Zn uptake system ZnuABC Zn-binding protein ZnuA